MLNNSFKKTCQICVWSIHRIFLYLFLSFFKNKKSFFICKKDLFFDISKVCTKEEKREDSDCLSQFFSSSLHFAQCWLFSTTFFSLFLVYMESVWNIRAHTHKTKQKKRKLSLVHRLVRNCTKRQPMGSKKMEILMLELKGNFFFSSNKIIFLKII